MKTGVSERLVAELDEGIRYGLTNKDLRQRYGRPRISAGVRREIADDLERAGLEVISDPSEEPLVVQRRGIAASAGTPEPVPSRRRPGWLKVLGLMGGVVTVGVIPFLTLVKDNPELCQFVAHSGRDFPFCSAKHRPVDTREAQDAVDTFFASAAGASPVKAWKMMDAEDGRGAFVRYWTPVLGAETSRVHEVDGFNNYSVRVRTYRDEAPEATKDWRLQVLEKDGGGFTIEEAEPRGSISELRRVQRVTYAEDAGLHWVPRAHSDFSVAPRTEQLNVGGTLKGLCQIDIQAPGRSRDRGWWTRTQLGWARNTALGNGADTPLPGVGRCFPHAREL